MTRYVNSEFFTPEICQKGTYRDRKNIDLTIKNCAKSFAVTEREISEYISVPDEIIEVLSNRATNLGIYNRAFLDAGIKELYISHMFYRLVDLKSRVVGLSFLDPAVLEAECFDLYKILLHYNRITVLGYSEQRLSKDLYIYGYDYLPDTDDKLIETSRIIEGGCEDVTIIREMIHLISEKAVAEERILSYEGLIHALILHLSSICNPYHRLHYKRHQTISNEGFTTQSLEILNLIKSGEKNGLRGLYC